ncbi:MAG: ABC transporter permease [Deltaproteobacteria bacterium]|nr:ABC transporter permease [Deltaproteobacteria bacterium]
MSELTTARQPEEGEEAQPARRPADLLRALFVRLGVLPFLLVAALVMFTLLSDQFLTVQNLVNLLRQSVYLILVSLGQMLALVTGGFDLSVGTIQAVTSVVSARAMSSLAAGAPEAVWLPVLAGCLAGILAGMAVGVVNGIGVAYVGVTPFIMTLGVQSIGFGVALFLTGGVPVSGMPAAFSDTFGFGTLLGVPVPILITVACVFGFWVLLDRTALGNYFHAVGGNPKATLLSGISNRQVLMMAYLLCAGMAALAGLLLTARVDSGEANIGGTVALESIAACVIGGVSLRGGLGRVENVVLGAIFIGLVQNGMNLAEVGSYLQMVVLGTLLIIAVISDQLRLRYFTRA